MNHTLDLVLENMDIEARYAGFSDDEVENTFRADEQACAYCLDRP